MTRTIAIAQQKGGVGKTTVTLNLAAAAANTGMSVLVVDMDAQANASQTLLPDYDDRFAASEADRVNSPFYTTNELMNPGVEPGDADEAIVSTPWPGVDLIPSDYHLADRDAEGSTGIDTRLRVALRGMRREYDLILIDCPPALGHLTVNSLLASQEVLLVAHPDAYSAQAVSKTRGSVAMIKTAYEHTVTVLGLVLNNYEPTRAADAQRERFEADFGRLLAVIPKRTAMQAAAAANQSVFTVNRADTGLLIATFERLVADLGLRRALSATGS